METKLCYQKHIKLIEMGRNRERERDREIETAFKIN